MRTTAVICLLGLAVASAACAGNQPSPSPTPGAPGAAAAGPGAVVGPPQVAWATMNLEQRKEYMKAVVLPKMKETFGAFDSVRYEKMNCATCHGDGATDGTFRMPNPKLPKLPNSPEGFKKLMADKPAMSQFMMTKVKPIMAQLLGLPEFNMETKTGFGCMECHTN
jgi:hypothetical protein